MKLKLLKFVEIVYYIKNIDVGKFKCKKKPRFISKNILEINLSILKKLKVKKINVPEKNNYFFCK